MRHLIRFACLLSVLHFACPSSSSAQAPVDSSDAPELAIVDVSVLPMTGAGLRSGQTILIGDGVITAIGPSEEVTAPQGTLVVDGHDRFLIPGLSDMHAHVSSEAELLLYVINGVTRIRNMWGSHSSLAMRARSESGDLVAPAIITAGGLLDGDPPVWGAASQVVGDPEAARRIMAEERAAGFDFSKTYEQLSAESFEAIAAYSRETGHPFAGHVPRAVSVEKAMRSGMRSIEHNSRWAEATRAYQPRSPAEATEILQRIERGEAGWGELFDLERTRELAELAAETGVWHVPTLTWAAGVYTSRRQAASRFEMAGMEHLSPSLLALWHPETNPGFRRLTDESLEAFQTLLGIEQLRVRALHDAGAGLLLGTDAPNPFVPTGYAVHDELSLLVDAGLTPYESLATGTSAVSEFLGDTSAGSIEVGKVADLVLLDGNPLQNIVFTRQISGVVLRGRWLDRSALDSLLEQSVASYQVPENWFSWAPSRSSGTDAVVYSISSDSLEIGAERMIRTGGDGDVRVTRAERSFLGRTGGLTAESVRIEEGEDGTVTRLTYRQAAFLGATEISVEASGGRLSLTGHTVDGQSIRRTVELPADANVSCELIACLGPVVDAALELGVGEERTVHLQTLEASDAYGAPSGSPRFRSDTWEVTRLPDEEDLRRFKAEVAGNGGRWSLVLALDDSGVVRIQRLNDFRRFAATRQ